MVTLGTWGNALACRINREIVRLAGLRPGQVMEMRLNDDGSIRLWPVGRAAQTRAKAAHSAQAANETTKEEVKW